LHLGRPIGLILTGLLGLTLMVSIFTGVLVHRKKLPQLFTFRPQKSFSLLLNDGHKVMGVWGVVFHSILAFTGAFLGLATVILVPAAAYVSFGGDQEKLIETFTATKAPVISNVDQPTKIAEILSVAEKEKPDLAITNLTIMGYGDKNALVYVFGAGDENLGGQTLVFEGATATLLKVQSNFGRLEGVTGKILDALFPLHFGNFAGIFVKAVWAWLGLAMSLLPISGIMLWVERGLSNQHSAHSTKTYATMGRLLSGCCGGIVLAVSVLFPTQLLLNEFVNVAGHTTIIFSVFFFTWAMATLAGLVFEARRGFKVLGYLIAFTLISVMPLDALLTNSHLLNVLETEHF
ncbi:MAG: PepSY-associated TM helix domain-containing protein, partial [Pseudomonadota bacterium]|nr:PepSY-associated TM helix domain-containing protein [Pseudomonadota bacterium]